MDLTCVQCTRPFKRTGSRGPVPRFCTRRCQSAGERQRAGKPGIQRGDSVSAGCERCGETFAYVSAGGARRRYCPPCRAVVTAESQAASALRRPDYQRNYAAANSERRREAHRVWRSRNVDRVRRNNRANRLARYGHHEVSYDLMVVSQQGRCACCGRDDPLTNSWHVDTERAWAIDHDHACCPPGQGCAFCVSALLCFACNTNRLNDEQIIMKASYVIWRRVLLILRRLFPLQDLEGPNADAG